MLSLRTNTRPHAIPALAATALLLVALGTHPYGYYTFLRWAVCLSAGIVAWVAWQSRVRLAAWAFLAVGVLFNPVIPIYMARSEWQPIDAVCAGLFALSLLICREESSARTTD